MVAPSSLLYWTSSPSTATTTSMDGSGGEMRRSTSTTTSSTTRGSSRNKSGKVLAKKPPQRGLGVAQLERLRIQERWKKISTEFDATGITTTTQLNHFPHLHQFPFQEQQNLLSSLSTSSSSVPMIAAAGFSFQEQQICNLSSSPPVNFVFNPYRSGGGGGGSSGGGVRSLYSDHHFQANGNGNNDHHYHPFESSKLELSSNQKSSSHCLYDNCDVCLKKKRMMINNGEILGFEGGRSAATQYMERKSFDGSDFLGLDLGRNWSSSTINGSDGGNQIRRSSSSGITTTNINDVQEEVEVMAIHRKGKTSIGGGGGGGGSSSSSSTTVLMEYDFFPRKTASGGGGRSSRSVIKKELPVSLFGGDQGGGESSSSATNNLLDLSLKLSC